MYRDKWFDSMEKIYFSSCGIYELRKNMNIYIQWIQYEFMYFLHFKYMNSYKYEFLSCMNSYIFCSYHVWIHIFFAVQNKSCERVRAASACRERAARAASAQCKLQARSASCEGKAQAHLLPQPGRARLPRPLELRAAAPIVRVACSCPIVRVHMAALIVRVVCGCPDS
jgi:hypothetical protein